MKEEPIEFEKTAKFRITGPDVTFTAHLRWSDLDRLDGVATDADLIAALNGMTPERRSAILQAVAVGADQPAATATETGPEPQCSCPASPKRALTPEYMARRIAFSEACEGRLDAAPQGAPCECRSAQFGGQHVTTCPAHPSFGVEPQGAPRGPVIPCRHHDLITPGLSCARCGQERCAECHMTGRHHSKCTKEVVNGS